MSEISKIPSGETFQFDNNNNSTKRKNNFEHGFTQCSDFSTGNVCNLFIITIIIIR